MRSPHDRRRFLESCVLVAAGGTGGGLLQAWLSHPSLAAPEQPKRQHNAEEQVKKLKLVLPPVEKSKNPLVPAVRAGDLLFVSGHGPGPIDGKPTVGKLGQDFDLKQGQAAARDIGLRILSVVREELFSLNKVARLVKVLGMVNCTPDFKQQPQVINGFSELMIEVFGEAAGKGARSAVGMASLPGGIPVEIEAVFQVD